MNNMASAVSSRPHAPLARVLALLLFAFISYGATAEVVHRHGNFVKAYDETTSSISPANDEGSAARDSRSSGACLICQLHQNLFFSLFNEHPRLVPPTAPLAQTAAQPTSYLLQLDAPRRGRAPPLSSLL
jgi:hypothetical protein